MVTVRRAGWRFAGDREMPRMMARPCFPKRVRAHGSALIPPRAQDQSPPRCGRRLKESKGSANVCQRRELVFSDERDRGLDVLGDAARKRHGEKLNDERRESACWSGSGEGEPSCERAKADGYGAASAVGPRKRHRQGVVTIAGGNFRGYRSTHGPQTGPSDASSGTEGEH